MADRWVRPSVVRWLSGLFVSVTAVAAVSVLIGLLDPHVPVLSLLVLYILAVLPVALVWGTGLAVVTSILSTAVFAYLFLPPTHTIRVADSRELAAIGVFLVTAVVMGELAARSRRVTLESARLSREQSALRRVATLVARSGRPSVVFEAVTREVGLLCDADLARMERYEEDGTVTGVAVWGRVPAELAVGTRIDLDGLSIARGVAQTGGPVRVDSFGQDTGAIAQEARALGIRASVGCPIVVGGRLWGVVAASTNREEPFPPDTEEQIARFTELVATAIANAQAREELRDEVALPGEGQDGRADPGQGELHPDGDAVAAPGLPVVQDAGGRWATERLDPTGQGDERGHDAGHGEPDAKPRTGVRLTPSEPHEAKEPLDEHGHAQVAPGSRPTGAMLFHVVLRSVAVSRRPSTWPAGWSRRPGWLAMRGVPGRCPAAVPGPWPAAPG
jgi:Domain of unknown function (DUF4118)/GAF domain